MLVSPWAVEQLQFLLFVVIQLEPMPSLWLVVVLKLRIVLSELLVERLSQLPRSYTISFHR